MTSQSQRPEAQPDHPVGRPLARPVETTTSPLKPHHHAEGAQHREPSNRAPQALPIPDLPPLRYPDAELESSDRHPRVSGDQLARLAARLSDRDTAVLKFISQHRYASTAHVRHVFFYDHASQSAATRATIRVLDRLMHLRLLTRLERRIGGSGRGSASTIWHLAAIGERLTRPNPHGPRRRLGEASLHFLAHSLAVTDTRVTLTVVARTRGIELSRIEVETEAWRSFAGQHGTNTILQPDLALTISTSEYDDHFYIEVDRATESTPVLVRKCLGYNTYRLIGHAQAEHGVFPRVIWIVPTKQRADRLIAAIESEPALPRRIFTVITPDQLIATVFDEETAVNGP